MDPLKLASKEMESRIITSEDYLVFNAWDNQKGVLIITNTNQNKHTCHKIPSLPEQYQTLLNFHL